MTPFFDRDGVTIYHGDCLAVLPELPDNSVDSIVTDPPYGLAFMGKKWDYDVPSIDIWAECLRVLKPGGHLLAFAGTRTHHRICCCIEDAGFEIRDMIAWVYGSGFPKSLDVSKAIDKAAGAEREVVGSRIKAGIGGSQTFAQDAWTQANRGPIELSVTAPATEDAKRWQGWGTALKPSLEPITVARKPMDGTVAANVLAWGTGAINVDACRVAGEAWKAHNATGLGSVKFFSEGETPVIDESPHDLGRWPANLIHDGSEEVTGLMGEASRFFYCAKAAGDDRDEGCEGMEAKYSARDNGFSDKLSDTKFPRANTHPTVKPTDLMRYLCRLVTPPKGLVLDPFLGSGSTAKAAQMEGFRCIGIEQHAAYCEIAAARVPRQKRLF